MPRDNGSKKTIEQYTHNEQERLNNPPVGLVTPDTDKDGAKKQYQYDPHLDPQLVWAGKAEHTSFEVPTVSLHVHERIDPKRIIEQVRKEEKPGAEQMSLFAEQEKRPLREAVEFYKHKDGWTNRLIAGDSLLVMNSLLEKEGMGEKVQMVYFDPPYGIKYGSNFQPFVNKRDVKDGKDEDLSSEPEMIKAFRDTWELGLHSYLTYLRDRISIAKGLLNEKGCIFVQISDENVHHVREILDEIFGSSNYCGEIIFKKTSGSSSTLVGTINDFLLWYAKDKSCIKFHTIFKEKLLGGEGTLEYKNVELPDGTIRRITEEEILNPQKLPNGARIFVADPVVSEGGGKPEERTLIFSDGKNQYKIDCGPKRHWKTTVSGMNRLWEVGRLLKRESLRIYKRYFEDFPYIPYNSMWDDTRGETDMEYVVQTSRKVIERCLLMCTDPGDLVLDITCGSGTTAFISEQWGRRWITCDTSRVAITLAKQRLMTASFDFYELSQPREGIASGFKYKTVSHITLKSIANNEPPPQEVLYDQPLIDTKRKRITGPFTVEAVPAPTVKSFEEIETSDIGISDASVTRSGETLRQSEWRQELLKTGVRGKNGQYIKFSRIEPMSGTLYLQAEGETTWCDAGANSVAEPPAHWKPQKVLICFGPEHAPLEQRMVENAWQEARAFRPDLLLFCAFQFDEEAAKDIDELPASATGMQLLKVQMNADLLTDDLRKKRSSNESFWLIGQPEVELKEIKKGEHKGKYQVDVLGFDYYNPKTGNVESGGKHQIAMWMLDTNYDGRSLFPSQVFFPMAGASEGWATLARNLKAEIDEEKIEAFRGTESIPFEPGNRKCVAVKIVDDRGIESLKIIRL
ncbi:MAG: site-specific DNA-methyltransferase [Fibrobacter sp.]|nr:site-specific DNA-methyltransferase [Fibrobacter sp.]